MQKKDFYFFFIFFKQKTTLEFSVKKIQRPCLIHWASGFTLWCGPIYTNSLHWPVEVQQTLPALGLEVLDVLGLIEDQIAPRLSPEGLVILQHQLVRSDANVESIWLCPALRRESVTEWLIIFQHSVFHFIQYLSNMSTVAGNARQESYRWEKLNKSIHNCIKLWNWKYQKTPVYDVRFNTCWEAFSSLF